MVIVFAYQCMNVVVTVWLLTPTLLKSGPIDFRITPQTLQNTGELYRILEDNGMPKQVHGYIESV